MKKDEKKQLQEQQMQRLDKLDQEGIPYCPKCKSTTLQYVERRKRLSLGRAVVGSLINPLAGVVGAVTSKKYKGKLKCLKCGKEWKL